MTARTLLVPALLVLSGCSATIDPGVGTSTHALDCAADQVCPDGTLCPEDGVCAEPDDAWADDCDARAAACANEGGEGGPDPEACADWLDACFANGDDDGGDEGGGDDAACQGLMVDCWNGGAPDRIACGEWLHECAPEGLQDWVGDDGLEEVAVRACNLMDQACAQGLDDACWLAAEVCQGNPQDLNPIEVRDHACGLLDEACGMGFPDACDIAGALQCPGGDGGGGDDGGDGGDGGDGADGGVDCSGALNECMASWDRDPCFDWFEACAPPGWIGEGEGCADAVHACGDGDLDQCQAWIDTCAPASVREPECIETLTACASGDDGACQGIQGDCL